MRFLHTSDWHLGRIFHGLHMTDDQAIVLEELIALVKESNVDAVLIPATFMTAPYRRHRQ